jgi:hypothetical protein
MFAWLYYGLGLYAIRNFNEPDPTTSLICSCAGVDAIRAGIIKGTLLDGLPKASSTGPKGFDEIERKGVVVNRCNLRGSLHEQLPKAISLSPSFNGLNAVFRVHGLPVVPSEAVAQGEYIPQAIGRYLGSINHLRFNLMVGIGAEKGVVDKIAVVARDIGGRPDGIENLQVSLCNEAQCLLACLSTDRWSTQRGRAGCTYA